VTGSYDAWEGLLLEVDRRLAPGGDALGGVADAWQRARASFHDELDPVSWGVDVAAPMRLTVAGTGISRSRAALAKGEADAASGWRARLAFRVADARRLPPDASRRGLHGAVSRAADGVGVAPAGTGSDAGSEPVVVVDFAALAVLEAALGARAGELEVTDACVRAWTSVADLVPLARIELTGGAVLEVRLSYPVVGEGSANDAVGWAVAQDLARCRAGNLGLGLLAAAALHGVRQPPRTFVDLKLSPEALAAEAAGVLGGAEATATLRAIGGRFGPVSAVCERAGGRVEYRLRVGPPRELESPQTPQ